MKTTITATITSALYLFIIDGCTNQPAEQATIAKAIQPFVVAHVTTEPEHTSKHEHGSQKKDEPYKLDHDFIAAVYVDVVKTDCIFGDKADSIGKIGYRTVSMPDLHVIKMKANELSETIEVSVETPGNFNPDIHWDFVIGYDGVVKAANTPKDPAKAKAFMPWDAHDPDCVSFWQIKARSVLEQTFARVYDIDLSHRTFKIVR